MGETNATILSSLAGLLIKIVVHREYQFVYVMAFGAFVSDAKLTHEDVTDDRVALQQRLRHGRIAIASVYDDVRYKRNHVNMGDR